MYNHAKYHEGKKKLIGVVVPALELGGGVPSVADFVCRTIERSDAFEYRLISLATSARDDISVGLTRPTTWMHGVRTCQQTWQGRPITRVGASRPSWNFNDITPGTHWQNC